VDETQKESLLSIEAMSQFRTIEIADARFETEGLLFVTVKSKALAGRADVTMFAPSDAKTMTGVPLVILLNGVYGSHWGWALKGGAHRTVQRLLRSGVVPPLALAMPSDGLWGDGSGYVDHTGKKFERWIAEEVPAAAREVLPCLTEQSPLFLAGLSMGGFGALRIGAKYPERFLSVAGHSSITHLDQMAQFVEEDFNTLGVAAEDRSVLQTILSNQERLRPFRFDCGTSDVLIEQNRELHRQLLQNGIPHEYEEFEGGHEWPYWERHLEDTLRFFARTLKAHNK
jgi:putative tributyrin esterase